MQASLHSSPSKDGVSTVVSFIFTGVITTKEFPSSLVAGPK